MKKTRIFIAIAAIAAVSCAKDIVLVEKTAVSFEAELSPVVKTVLGSESEGTCPVLWSGNDQIIVFNAENPDGVQFDLESGAGTSSAVFTGTISGTAPYYATYACNDAVLNGDKLTFSTLSSQNWEEGSFASFSNPAVAKSDGMSLSFKNLFGIMAIRLDGSATVGKVEIIDAGGTALWGSVTYDFSADTIGLSNSYSTSSKLTLLGGKALSSSPSEYCFLVPSRSFGSGFEVRIFDDFYNIISSIKSDKNNAVAASKMVRMPSKTVETPSVIDLSLVGSANSYIAPTAASYKFKAVKGNSDEALAVSEVSVIWEWLNDNENTPSIGSVITAPSFADGYVSFTSTGTPGNAVIGAKNASGEVIWSWHIWATPAFLYDQYYAGLAMMNLNLGALNNDPGDITSLGLLYQWGRKDPFPGTGSYSVANTAAGVAIPDAFGVTAPTNVFSKNVDNDTATHSVSYSIQNPSVYLCRNVAGGNNLDWLLENHDQTLWGTGDGKSIYDPCPVGYRVPEKNIFEDFSSANFFADSEGKGCYSEIGGQYIWFPVGGWIWWNPGTMQRVGDTGYYWFATANDSSDGTRASDCSFNLAGSLKPSTYARAGACSVRCCAE